MSREEHLANARKGGNNSMGKRTVEERTALGRMAARARWDKKELKPSNLSGGVLESSEQNISGAA